jgi:hypothetical protein
MAELALDPKTIPGFNTTAAEIATEFLINEIRFILRSFCGVTLLVSLVIF